MIAHELGLDDAVVRKWPPSKIREWWSYLAAKGDLEKEALEKARREANSPTRSRR